MSSDELEVELFDTGALRTEDQSLGISPSRATSSADLDREGTEVRRIGPTRRSTREKDF